MSARRLFLILAAAASAVALAACGSSSSPSSNGVASKSPQQILSSVLSAVKGTKSVHIAGSVTSGGQKVDLDLHVVNGQGGEGNMAVAGLSVQLVVVGNTIYIKGSPAFWRHFGGAAAAQLFKDKWLKAPETGSFGSFAKLTDLSSLFSQIASTNDALKKGSTSTINGQQAIAIIDSTKGGTMYVATSGQPYPLLISKSGGTDAGRVTFDQFNQSVTLTAPKGAIDISQFQGA